MHVVNLVIEYMLGIKENTKTHKRVVDGKMQKVKEILTTGGEFADGLRVIKAGQLICNLFTGSPKRKQKLEDVVECHDLPSIVVTNGTKYLEKLGGCTGKQCVSLSNINFYSPNSLCQDVVYAYRMIVKCM